LPMMVMFVSPAAIFIYLYLSTLGVIY